MGIRLIGPRNVLEAAKIRVELSGKKYPRIYVSFSGGKDSTALAGTVELCIEEGRLDPSKVEFLFIDEEAVYPDVIENVMYWRKKVLLLGCKFHWLCLPVKHFNCFNELESDMSFICWDPRKRDKWVRQMPDFATKSHPMLRPGDSYQYFLEQVTDGMHMIGLRASESLQRTQVLSRKQLNRKLYPIYDWRDTDVWKLINDRDYPVPEAYLNMYKAGMSTKELRLSQFFSIDTARGLVRLFEFYPGLYERILQREPNAYLAMYYWDSEMFRRKTQKRTELEGEKRLDYKMEVMRMLPEWSQKDPSKAKQGRSLIAFYGHFCSAKVWERLYGAIVAGDPKGRTFRAIYSTFQSAPKSEDTKEEQ